jgi:hypothetical protein
MTEEEVNTYFAQLNASGEISDDELDAVAGGGSCPGGKVRTIHSEKSLPVGSNAEAIDGSKCPKCGATKGIVKSTAGVWNEGKSPTGVWCDPCGKWITSVATIEGVIVI